MIDLDELTALNLGDLAALLAEQAPSWTGVLPDQWLSALELFTSRLASADRRSVVQDLSLLRHAYETLIAAAFDGGAIDKRESVLRIVNLLVALAASSNSDADADEFAAEAKRLALKNIPMSLENAQVAARDWRALPMDEIRDMRYARNLLSPLRPIMNRGHSEIDSAMVDAWLDLLPALP
jgi:hypothetical protein